MKIEMSNQDIADAVYMWLRKRICQSDVEFQVKVTSCSTVSANNNKGFSITADVKIKPSMPDVDAEA